MARLRSLLEHPRFPLLMLVAALAVRLAWLAWVDPEPVSDFEWYFHQAQRIGAGQGYTVTDDGCPLWERGAPLPVARPTAFWPMGYPLFLGGVLRATAGFLPPLVAARLANIALYLGLMLAMAWCAERIFRSRLAGRLTLVALAFLPNHIAYVAITSAESPFALLVAVGAALAISAHGRERLVTRLAAGVIFGLATWTKPQAVLLPGLLLAVLHAREPQRLLRAGLVVYVALALTLVPLWVRNQRAFGRFVFVSTNGGVNLVIGNMPGAYAPGVFWNRELTAIVRGDTSEISRDVKARRLVTAYVTRHPLAVLAGLPKKAFQLLAFDVDGFGWSREGDTRHDRHPAWTWLRVFSQLYYLALWALALLSVRVMARADRALYAVGPALLLYLVAVYLVFFGGGRFHFPLVPWIAAYASGTVAALLAARAGSAAPEGPR